MKPELSVIIPVTERYDDARSLYLAYRDAVAAAARRYEFLYVLEGGYEGLRQELQSLHAAGEPIRILRVAAGAGEATAIMLGVENTSADTILLLPAYGQVAPESLTEFIQQAAPEDILLARRWPRRDSLLNRVMTATFNKLLAMITDQKYRDIGCGVRLIKRRVFDEISLYGDQHRFLPVLATQRGFSVREVELPQADSDLKLRIYRPGIYLRRLLDLLAVFFVVKFTKKPLRFFGLIGSGLAAVGLLVLAVIVAQKLFLGVGLAERPLLLLGVLMLVLGVQLFALGLIGELIIFTHARELKEYTVAERVNFDAQQARSLAADEEVSRFAPINKG